jgi:hypothetical protein
MVIPLMVKAPVESISNARAEVLDVSQPNIAIDPVSIVEAISNSRDAGTTVEVVRKVHSNIKTVTSTVIRSNTRVIVKQGALEKQPILASSPDGVCPNIKKKKTFHTTEGNYRKQYS